MRLTYKYRLQGTKNAFAKAKHWLYLCCWLYNTALNQRISIYKQNKGRISCFSQQKQLVELRKYFPEYQDVFYDTLQEVIQRLDKTYANFYRRVKNNDRVVGFPRYKNINRYDSFTLKVNGWKLEGKYLNISKLGKFKIRLSLPIVGNIKTVTIRKERTGKWYVCFNCDNIPTKLLPKTDKSIGIDVGISSFLTDSDGNKIDSPHYFQEATPSLRINIRKLHRRIKGSNRREQARLLFAKVHEKVKNQRNDFLHKLANHYIKNYDTISIESLYIPGLKKRKYVGKAISDNSWGKFYELCDYKAEEAGRTIIRIPRFEPTSKTCSNCSEINHSLKLNDRQWVCKSCGVLHDRDYNAAKNIKRVGQTQQALTCAGTQSVACKSPRITKRRVSTPF